MPADEEEPSFPTAFNIRVAFGPDGSLSGRFGTDVLDELIAGIDEFQQAVAAQPAYHSLGPAMLGAFAWLDDNRLLARIARYPYACVPSPSSHGRSSDINSPGSRKYSTAAPGSPQLRSRG